MAYTLGKVLNPEAIATDAGGTSADAGSSVADVRA